MKLRKYTEAQLRAAVQTSAPLRQVLLQLGVAPYGGNYAVFKKAITTYGLDTSHFTGQAWNKGRRLPAKQPLHAYLNNTAPIQSFKLKNRLLKDGVFQRRCVHCGQSHWRGHPIPLELDHIDGNASNNALENLRLLCPNCHALTPTYRSKNRTRA